jgi:hypothetical protein
MAIRLDPKAADPQGLPVVTWEEDRNLFAPGGVSAARVACFIRPDGNGVLQFVSVGLVRHGEFEEARPWEALAGFEVSSADKHYRSAAERALLDMLASKSKSGAGRLLTTDGAFVILANFADEKRSVPMHLNCANRRPVEADMLHDRLRLEFIDRQRDLIAERCDGAYVWPKDKPFVAHVPAVATPLPWWMVRLADLLIVVVLGLIVGGLYLLLGR